MTIGLFKELRRCAISCVFVFFHAAVAVGQQGYVIHHYTNENGLPANGLKAIELDERSGYLWIGSQAGLVRFDGKDFEPFGSAKLATLPSRINYIGKNREGAIYCEEDNFSVYRIDSNQARWVAADSFYTARFLYRGRGSNPDMPVRELVLKVRQTPRSAYLPPWIVFHDEPGDSSSWSMINFDHVYYYRAQEDSLYDFPGFRNVLKIGGRVYWSRPDLGLWTFDGKLQKPVPVPVHGMPSPKRQGVTTRYIWSPGMPSPLLIDNEDIWELVPEGQAVRAVPLCRACCPAKANITSAQVWKERGIIFLASETNGLYVARAPFLQPVRSVDAAANAGVEYAQAEIVPGRVHTAMGLTYSTDGRSLPGKIKPAFPNSNIYQDRQGSWWFSSGDTVIRFHPGEERLSKIVINDGSSKIVFAESGNQLYVISDKGIGAISDGRYRPLYRLPFQRALLRNTLLPMAAVEWEPGVLAIATEKLLFFDTRKAGVPDTVVIPGLSAPVRSLLKYGGYLLIGTYGQGFYMYKNGLVKKMPTDKKQYLAYTHCFVPDGQGYCWISTNHGLFKASLAALAAAYENDPEEIYYHYFGKDDGLLNTEFNGGCQPCALRLSNGKLSFPTMNGVALLDPQRPSPLPPSGQLFIDAITADARSIQPADSLLQRLPYPIRNLRVRVSLPHFGNAENVYFSYKLVPYNDSWERQDILQNNTLQFGGLKPGTYSLHLRVRNGYAPDQFGTVVLAFRILPPWYQSWWFYLLCGLAFVLLTGALVKWRTARINQRKKELQRQVAQQTLDIAAQSRQLELQLKQLQQQQATLEEDNEIKARLIGIISHDMIGPLKFMSYISKKLRDQSDRADNTFQTADFLVTAARKLEALSVNMLNWIRFHHSAITMKPDQFDLRELVAASVEIAATLAREKGVPLYNDVPGATYLLQYREAIGVVVYNLAMNAAKHTASGEIRVAATVDEEHVWITIADTGCGMPPELVARLNAAAPVTAGYPDGEPMKSRFGYVIINDLMRLVGGRLTVESSREGGTKVTVCVKKSLEA